MTYRPDIVRLFVRDRFGARLLMIDGESRCAPEVLTTPGERPYSAAIRGFYDILGLYRTNFRLFARLTGHATIHCYSIVLDENLSDPKGWWIGDRFLVSDRDDGDFRNVDDTTRWLFAASRDPMLRSLRGGLL